LGFANPAKGDVISVTNLVTDDQANLLRHLGISKAYTAT